MIKLVYVVRRRSDVPADEFRRYWLEEHGPLVKSIAPQHGSRRYVQSHTIDTPMNDALVSIRGMSPWYDGITEIWVDSLEALQEELASEVGQLAFGQLGEETRRSSSTSPTRRCSSPRSTRSSRSEPEG
jgi:uncharacterized protein (TIGR02118 family)